MMPLLRCLHQIAAQRGDGLRPELTEMSAPSPAWASVERLGRASPLEGLGVKPVEPSIWGAPEPRSVAARVCGSHGIRRL